VAAPPRASGPFVPPPVAARVSYQLGGPYDPPPGVTVVDRDHTVDPVPGTYGICYVNAFQAETAEVQDWQREHPDTLLRRGGDLVVDERWDEPLLDTSTAARRTAILAKVGGWIDECARRGYQGVELDNLDAATRSQGLLTDDDSFALAADLITRAHAKGLAVAQKNAAELSARGRSIGFDLAVAEECQVYDECGLYTDAYGTALVEIEYTDTPPDAFTTACRQRARTASVVLRDRDVTPVGDTTHVERWCP
ncbi:MAG: endo alpha-1,4 polygalactosaminidase, partial [Mycobacteriaceae bacterium]